MDIKVLYKAIIAAFIFANLSFSMEGSLDDLSWLDIARMERDAASVKKNDDDQGRDFAETFKRKPIMRFKDFVGEIPEEIIRMVNKINIGKDCQEFGLCDIAQEVLLIGPPGTGKSSLAEAIAAETGRDFYKVSSSSLINSYQGSGAGTIKAIFECARKNKCASVVFIDEIDGISNSEMKSKSEESDRTTKELLAHIDLRDPSIICVLATNNYENLSAALKDRFAHKTITVPLPDYAKRLAILKHYAKKQKLNISKDFLSKLARLTDQLSCRNLEKLSYEAFDIAFEEQFKWIKKDIAIALMGKKMTIGLQKRKNETNSKEKNEANAESNDDENLEQPFAIKDIHYLVAVFTTQNTTFPSFAVRVVLFNYFFKKNKLAPGAKHVAFLAKKTERFAAKDIKAIVDNIYAIYTQNNRTYGINDIYAGLFYDQTINFADSYMRETLFAYYLKGKNTAFIYCNQQDLSKVMAYYLEDDFTGKEISDIVNGAAEMAEVYGTAVTESYLIIVLYNQLMKKAKPFIISTISTCDTHEFKSQVPSGDIKQLVMPMEQRTQMRVEARDISPLPENQKFSQSNSFEIVKQYKLPDQRKHKNTRLDYRTKVQPNWSARCLLIQYFLEDISHSLSINQTNYLSSQLEGLSWYSLEQLINLAKNHQVGTCSSRLMFSHLRTAAYEFDITLYDLKADQSQESCILS